MKSEDLLKFTPAHTVTSSVLSGTGAHCAVIQHVICLLSTGDLKLPLTGGGYLWARAPSPSTGELTSSCVKSMSITNGWWPVNDAGGSRCASSTSCISEADKPTEGNKLIIRFVRLHSNRRMWPSNKHKGSWVQIQYTDSWGGVTAHSALLLVLQNRWPNAGEMICWFLCSQEKVDIIYTHSQESMTHEFGLISELSWQNAVMHTDLVSLKNKLFKSFLPKT